MFHKLLCLRRKTNQQLGSIWMLGEVGEGYNLTKEWFMEERLMIAARCLGGAERCLEDAFAYATEREQFGERIIEFQGVSFPLAEAVAEIAAARAVTYQVAWEVTQGTIDPKTLHAKAASIKLFASEMANRVVDSCVQVLGGMETAAADPFDPFQQHGKT
jgi:alkylation response protein AidB-like acyl-CoA dehydrogenase